MSTIYKALLSQVNQNNPTSIEKQNTTTGVININRYGTGQYVIAEGLNRDNVMYHIQENVIDARYLMYVDDSGNLILETKWDSDGNGLFIHQDGMLNKTPVFVEIF